MAAAAAAIIHTRRINRCTSFATLLIPHTFIGGKLCIYCEIVLNERWAYVAAREREKLRVILVFNEILKFIGWGLNYKRK
jgi:hypothetical protein